MDRHEEAVMQLLTANGDTFVAPQYDVSEGWNGPDFVAIRPVRKRVYLVEVSASGYPLGLVRKINEREQHWYGPLQSQLQALGVMAADWQMATLVFVRSDQIDWVRARVTDMRGVHLLSLEEAGASWNWADEVWTAGHDFEDTQIAQRGPKASVH